MFDLYASTCAECSKLITQRYSTSFSLGIRAFDKTLRPPIYAIYGFVRFADEIVDTFHDHPKQELLDRFRADTFRAIEEGISLNPVLQSFQGVVNRYRIDHNLITAFLDSMEMDLNQNRYGQKGYEEYIFGSAEAVGLMCLYVFCDGDVQEYERLKEPACRLGAAFQKVNFLRDMGSDFEDRGRVYFPGVDFNDFSEQKKSMIEADIAADFAMAYEGIKQLPKSARFGVYLAYVYYEQLFQKIKGTRAEKVQDMRIRVADSQKMYLLFQTAVKHRLRLI